MTTERHAALARAYRADGGRVLATLIAQFRDFDLAEDALAEAMRRAAERWGNAPPANPAAWLLTVARRAALDRVRSKGRHARPDVQQAVADTLWPARSAADGPPDPFPDDRLSLIFTCCHPALAQDAQTALTLKTLGGLSVAEIARAFLVSPGALARRLTRAKTKIRDAAIPYEVPEAPELPARLPRVLEVIYLIYNESYAATEGSSLIRADLGAEALRLARLLHHLLPLPETAGLLALILHHDARRAARVGPDGQMIPLKSQDRRCWDRALISEGRRILLAALAQRRPGPYQIQAAISAVHNDAPDWDSTDWVQIAGLYRALEAIAPGPVVTLNRAVALLECTQLDQAAALIASVAPALSDYHPFYAARAELHHRQGNAAAARADLDAAIAKSTNAAERRYLATRRAQL